MCDEWHEGAPSASFMVPDDLLEVPPAQRTSRVELTSETAVLDGTRFFLRATLDIPIQGESQSFNWAIWVEVSKEELLDYEEAAEQDAVRGPYRGLLANRVPPYESSLGLPVTVTQRPDNQRPWLEPLGDQRLAVDYRDGMTAENAARIFERIAHPR
ncbi:DUF2199 domain-containing protein [Burkholderia cenocepacia]|uniref:DUF2199 domain-containing protein n=1 Tax=Burkholderia cenocepacia TaxID=95486 RepID=UPI000761C095|nr:DUF2199 domain-containing protein [Burkholderia cenocepacia]KWU17759.1 hypothetical protein AS149_13645 [Burkholderia cenocepacia]